MNERKSITYITHSESDLVAHTYRPSIPEAHGGRLPGASGQPIVETLFQTNKQNNHSVSDKLSYKIRSVVRDPTSHICGWCIGEPVVFGLGSRAALLSLGSGGIKESSPVVDPWSWNLRVTGFLCKRLFL